MQTTIDQRNNDLSRVLYNQEYYSLRNTLFNLD